MSRARELARLGNANAISIDSSNNVGFGTTTSIQYKLDVVGDAIIRGDLTVSGTRTYVNTNNLDISDNVIVLNRGIGSNENTNVSSGILVKRHGNNQFMGWDDIQNSFILGETTEDGEADPSGVVLAGKSDLKIKDMDYIK